MSEEMPLMCQVFGHKYIHEVTQKYYLAEFQNSKKLDVPRCKRCGKRIDADD